MSNNEQEISAEAAEVKKVYKRLSPEMEAQLRVPLPKEAVTPHPTKKFLSNIKTIYITERLNEVFGTGSWHTHDEIIERDNKMVVLKVTLHIPEYGIQMTAYGGNDNADLGDAFKGAVTDALSKIGSYLGIATEVFKGQHESQPQTARFTGPVTSSESANGSTNGSSTATSTENVQPTDWMTEIQFKATKERMVAAKAGTTTEDASEILGKAVKALKMKKTYREELEAIVK